MDATKLVLNWANENNGMFLTSDLNRIQVSRTHLSKMESQGLLERVSRGVYIAGDHIDDKLYYTQLKAKKIIYSHETALFFHGLTDRTPNKFSLTVPSSYKPSKLISENYKVYYIKKNLHGLGAIKVKTALGNEITIYNLERTICDVLRNRSKIDPQILNESVKKYVLMKNANFNLLNSYATTFGISKIVRQYMEILI